jgi:hypothetical protein
MHSLYGSLQQCAGLLKMNSGLGQISRKHQLKIETPPLNEQEESRKTEFASLGILP